MLNENASEIDFLFTSKMSKGNMTISFIYSEWNEYTLKLYTELITFLCLMPNYRNFHLYVIYPIAIFNKHERNYHFNCLL